jgi:hypothetical protein
MSAIGFGGFILGILWGSATAEAVRRASGGHRGGTVGIVAVVSLVLGTFLGGVSLITAIIAVVVALVQLAVIEWR